MQSGKVNLLPASSGRAANLRKGQCIKIINTHGTQVVDTWALSNDANVSPSYLSMSHSRGATLHFSPREGDVLVSNRRAPMLEFVQDTSPGIHDTVIAACDPVRYELLGAPGHASCTENFRAAVETVLGKERTAAILAWSTTPDPLNLFMNIPILDAGEERQGNKTAGGDVRFLGLRSKPGDFVVLRALMDCIVVMSACPQDLVQVGINVDGCKDCEFVLQDA